MPTSLSRKPFGPRYVVVPVKGPPHGNWPTKYAIEKREHIATSSSEEHATQIAVLLNVSKGTCTCTCNR